MRAMKGYDIHFIGSIPLKNSREVFATISERLGPRVLRIPDGETGERTHWLGWIEPIFSDNPAFEPTGESSRVHATSDPRLLHRLKEGIAAKELRFSNLRIADTAIASFGEFIELKSRGIIPSRCRFQVGIANPVSVVHRFVAEPFQERVVGIYEQAILAEIDKLAAEIPHQELAIQFDIAQHVFKPLETGEANGYGGTREEMLAAYAAMAVRWGTRCRPASIYFITSVMGTTRTGMRSSRRV